jgi:hypothetical protein
VQAIRKAKAQSNNSLSPALTTEEGKIVTMRRDAEQWRQDHLGTGQLPKNLQHIAGFVQNLNIRPGRHEVVMYTLEGLYLYGACLSDDWTAAAYLDTTGNMVRNSQTATAIITTTVAQLLTFYQSYACMCSPLPCCTYRFGQFIAAVCR